MRRLALLLFLGVCGLLHACGGDPAASLVDGGSERDAGSASADGGRTRDGGVSADGGAADGGADDGGPATDGGFGPDGGSSADGGLARDGGITSDAGSAADGGMADGGAASDGGAAADAGTSSDGGVVVGSGDLVTFNVTVPLGTPFFEGVYLAGSAPILGPWVPNPLRLQPRGDGRWTLPVRLPSGAATEYKLTRGTWSSVEKAQNGTELPNRVITPAGTTTVSLTVARWADTPSVAGRVESLGMVHSQFLSHDRPVLVYLPPGYASGGAQRYPVLYLHDGQNVFDGRTSFGGVEWSADEAAESLIIGNSVEPLIIVAVGNTAARIDEYTPVADSSVGGGGMAAAYGRFLAEELKPLVDATYRTRADAASTGVAGSSLGGLVSMYFGLTRASTFGRIGVISPSVWWANRDIVARVNALATKTPVRIWEDIGTSEGSGSQGETVADARALRDALVAKGWTLNSDLKYTEVTGGQHTESSWAARFPDVLRFLFPAP